MSMSRGFSLHIGLNAVDPEHYSGWDGKLNACESDAKSMAAIANSLKYNNVSTLLTQQATREAVTKEDVYKRQFYFLAAPLYLVIPF